MLFHNPKATRLVPKYKPYLKSNVHEIRINYLDLLIVSIIQNVNETLNQPKNKKEIYSSS